MHIGLNLLPFLPDVGGTWNYAAGLLAALAAHDSEHTYTAFVTSASADLVPTSPRIARRVLALHAASRPLRVAYENTLLRTAESRARIELAHHFFGTLPFGTVTPNVVTLYDLMVFERPGDFGAVKRLYLRSALRRAASRATMLAPISRATADLLHATFGVPDGRMQVVPAAIADEFAPAGAARVADFRARYSLPERFWLCVSGGYSHKNHEALLTAFAAIRASAPDRWPLVLRGELPPDALATIKRFALDSRVIVLPRLTDDDMPALYSAASALVFPSLYEGGGMPVMEAMACGCPVVASNIPTTSEFAKHAALMFDPLSVDALAAAMTKCEGSPALRTELAEAGQRAVTTLRPAFAAAACLSAYRRAAATR